MTLLHDLRIIINLDQLAPRTKLDQSTPRTKLKRVRRKSFFKPLVELIGHTHFTLSYNHQRSVH